MISFLGIISADLVKMTNPESTFSHLESLISSATCGKGKLIGMRDAGFWKATDSDAEWYQRQFNVKGSIMIKFRDTVDMDRLLNQLKGVISIASYHTLEINNFIY